MGGGKRTFVGGLNKWQWKRLHEKRAREKQKALLQQEKQLYQARIRSEIRTKLCAKPEFNPNPNNFSAVTSEQHIKALADRFMKEGAEDLWNENDGPVKEGDIQRLRSICTENKQLRLTGRNSQQSASNNSPIDFRKLMLESRNEGKIDVFGDKGYSFNQTRNFSVGAQFSVFNQRSGLIGINQLMLQSINEGKFKNLSDKDYNLMKTRDFSVKALNLVRKEGGLSDDVKKRGGINGKTRRFRRNESSSSGDECDYGFASYDGSEKKGKNMRGILGSKAALGRYDTKISKRVPLKELEKERDFEKEVKMIRFELEKRKRLVENDGVKGEIHEEESLLTQKRFDECELSPLTVKALTAAGYIQMTRVQEATLSICLEGKDALVKAKTGTGKSAAFLLPAIEAVLKAQSSNVKPRVSPIYVLILCPTRELASQLAAEANAILKYHDGIGVQTLVGGTRFRDDQKRLESNTSQIIVATPGRLLDHIENKGGLSVHLMGLKMLILDEADHLLDLGFRKDVEKIVDCLPRQRHSLMFSATIPKEVRRISQLVLNREHAYIDTVGLGCVETPVKVKQSFLIVPHELHFQVVHHLLKEHILQTPDYKVIVFCTTGMVASLMYTLLREIKMNVKEMHSRKPQLYRTRVSDEFKESKRSILVTSDVSARGMNYPGVTLVIQVGLPADREQYIHRLGRTGREGKDGEGILLLAPWEEYFLDELEDLPLDKLPEPDIDPESELKVEDSLSKIDSSIKEAAYHAWLGYYNSIRRIGRDKTALVELAKRFCESIGLQKPPPLFRKTALKMGLKDIPGIRIRA